MIIKTPTGLLQVDPAAKMLTQAQYDALPDREKDNGTYYITDSDGNNNTGDLVEIIGIIGDTDINGIGDGTITGAIYDLEINKASNIDLDKVKRDVENLKELSGTIQDLTIIGTTDISDIAEGTLTSGVRLLYDKKADKSAVESLSNKLNTSIANLENKADLDDLQAVRDLVNINSTDISNLKISKVNVSDFTQLKKSVETNTSNISTLSTSKADKSALDTVIKKADGNAISISNLSANKASQSDLDKLAKEVEDLKNQTPVDPSDPDIIGNTSLNGIGDGTITGAIRKIYDTKADIDYIDTKLSTKADTTALNIVSTQVSSNTQSITKLYSDIIELQNNKVDNMYFQEVILELEGKITQSELIGDTDISNIGDGTITNAISIMYSGKVNQSDFAELKRTVETNTDNITNLKNNTVTKDEYNTLSATVDKKTNQTDFDALKTIVNNLPTDLSGKANQSDLDITNKNVAANAEAIKLKANKTDLDILSGTVDTKVNQSLFNTTIASINTDISNINTLLGDSIYSDIAGDTLTAAVARLYEQKADKKDIDEFSATLNTFTTKVNTNTNDITLIKSDIEAIYNAIGDDNTDFGTTDISNIGDGTVTGAISSLNSNKANQSDFDNLSKQVEQNKTDIGMKADAGVVNGMIYDLADLKKTVTSNTEAIKSKASQSDLDVTTSKISNNTTAIADNTAAIQLKANRIDLDNANKLITTNTESIAALQGIIGAGYKFITADQVKALFA